MGVWLSFITILSLIGLFLIPEPRTANYSAWGADQNCGVYSESFGSAQAVKEIGAGQAKQEQTECIVKADGTKDYWDYALILFTILFTGGLVFIGWRQVVWMRRT